MSGNTGARREDADVDGLSHLQGRDDPRRAGLSLHPREAAYRIRGLHAGVAAVVFEPAGPWQAGQKNKERAPGSIAGAGRAGGRVAPGMRMAGRMGNERVTVKNLRVLQVDTETNTILISGAVPGRPGTIVEIRG